MSKQLAVMGVLVPILVIGAVSIFVIAPVAAQDADPDIDLPSVDRDGSDVRIAVSQDAFSVGAENASIDAELVIEDEGTGGTPGGGVGNDDAVSRTLRDAEETNGDYVFRFNLEPLAEEFAGVDSTANLSVQTPKSETIHRVDIRFLGLEGYVSTDGENFQFEATTLGFKDDDAVKVNATAGNASVVTDGQLRIDGDSEFLQVDPTELRPLPLFEAEVRVRAFTEDRVAEAESEPFDPVDAALPRVVVTERVELQHPLFFDGEEYLVSAETRGPDGKFVTRAEASRGAGPGIVSLPLSVVFADSVEITVEREGQAFLSAYEPTAAELSPATLEATVTEDGRLTVSGDHPLGIETGWVDDGESVTRISSVTSTNEGYRIDGYEFDSGDRYRLLLVGGSETVRIEATPAPTLLENQAVQGLAGVLAGAIGLISGLLLYIPAGGRRGNVGLGIGVAVAALGVAAAATFGGIAEESIAATGGAAGVLLSGAFAVRSRWMGTAIYILGVGVAIGGAGVYLEHPPGTIAIVGLAAMFTGLSLGSDLKFPVLGDGSPAAAIVAVLVTLVLFSVSAPITDLDALRELSVPFAGGVLAQFVLLGVVGQLRSGPAKKREASTQHEVTIQLKDSLGGEVPDKTEVEIKPTDDGEAGQSRSVSVSGGAKQITLEEGQWRFEPRASHVGVVNDNINQSQSIQIELDPQKVGVKVVDPGGNPIRDAAVIFDADRPVGKIEQKTDRNGEADVEVPSGTETVTASVRHNDYEPTDGERLYTSSRERIELRPKTGTLRVRAQIESEPAPGVTIVTTARSGIAEGHDLRVREQTNRRGHARFENVGSPYRMDGLPIGKYRITAEIPQSAAQFDPMRKSETVEPGTETTVRLPVGFEFDFTSEQRRRIRDLEAELDSLSKDPQRDMAIPGYFVSVIREVVALIESLPSSGLEFLGREESPSEISDALLSAAEAATSSVDYAMSAAASVDLFVACSDMRAADVKYEAGVSVETFFDIYDESPKKRRSRIGTRRDEVETRITDELGELADVAPAQEMHDQVNELVRSHRDADPLESAAVALVALTLLEATDELFDESELRERMSQTVF